MTSKKRVSGNQTWTREDGETSASFFARTITAVLLGFSVCSFVALLCALGAAAIAGNESLIFEARNLMLWTGAAVLAALVATLAS